MVATDAKRSRRPWFRRTLIGLAVLVSIQFAYWFYQAGWYWWNRLPTPAARTYTPPTTQHVVFDDDPQTYPQLLSLAGGGYVSQATSIPGSNSAAYINPAFDRYTRARTGGTFPAKYVSPVAFLHERISPKGNRRIVAVNFGVVKGGPDKTIVFLPEVPDRPLPTPPNARPIMSQQLEMHRATSSITRIFDGVADPNDSSRFTFVVEHNGRKTVIRGELRDDDRVMLTPAAGQLADYYTMRVWVPPGESIPPIYEPTCFVDPATTQPSKYFPSPRGIREHIDDKGMLVIEDLKRKTTRSTPAPSLPFVP